jgi:hypothetical protein
LARELGEQSSYWLEGSLRNSYNAEQLARNRGAMRQLTNLFGAVIFLASCSGSEDGSGGGVDSSSSVSAAGTTGATGGTAPDATTCLDTHEEPACIALGCAWMQATLFEQLACGSGAPVSTCVLLPEGGELTAPGTWSYQGSDGLLAMSSVRPPGGFSSCASGTTDVCTCLP